MATNAAPPQPGAQKNPMLGLGLPDLDVVAKDWITLPKHDAVNFTHAEPHLLNVGDTLYRVYGGPAHIVGGYWSPTPPAPTATQAEWRRETAVEYSWNDGTLVAKFTAVEPLQVWKGGIESQPAQDLEGNPLPDYWLVGGGTQYWVKSWPEPIFPTPTPVGPTPWAAAKPGPSTAAVALAEIPSHVQEDDEHLQQALLVAELARSLQSMADAISGSAAEAARLAATAAAVTRSANAIITCLEVDSDKAKSAVRAQLGLSRHVCFPAELPGAEQAHETLGRVVSGAARLSGLRA